MPKTDSKRPDNGRCVYTVQTQRALPLREFNGKVSNFDRLTFLCFRGIRYIKSTDSILFDGDNQVDCSTVFVADGRTDSSSVAQLDALWGCDVQQGMTPKSRPQLIYSDCRRRDSVPG